jgi:hypothetical protein
VTRVCKDRCLGVQDLPFATLLASCYGCIAAELLFSLEQLQAEHIKCYEKIVASISSIQANENAIRAVEVAVDSRLVAKSLSPGHAPDPGSAASPEPTVTQIADALLEAASMKLFDHVSSECAERVSHSNTRQPSRSGLLLAQVRPPGGRNSATSRLTNAAAADAMRRLTLPALGTMTWQVLSPHAKLEQLCMRLVVAQAHRQSSLVMVARSSTVEYLFGLFAAYAEEQLFELSKVTAVTSASPPSQVCRNISCILHNGQPWLLCWCLVSGLHKQGMQD